MDDANNEVVNVKLNKRSFWEVTKIVMFAFAITFMVNTLSYANVSYNHVWSKIIGVADDVAQFCANCLEYLG